MLSVNVICRQDKFLLLLLKIQNDQNIQTTIIVVVKLQLYFSEICIRSIYFQSFAIPQKIPDDQTWILIGFYQLYKENAAVLILLFLSQIRIILKSSGAKIKI